MTYAHEYEFLRDTTRLIEGGANLHDLYQAWLSAPDRDLDVSPERLRQLASRWTQSPDFVLIRLQELFEGLELEHSDDYVLAMVGHLADVGTKPFACSCCGKTMPCAMACSGAFLRWKAAARSRWPTSTSFLGQT